MEYKFFDEVHDFQRFVRQNIRLLGNYLIISEQLYVKNNETGIIDILAVDKSSKKLVIIELKNEITTDKNVWQPLRYYDLLRRGEDSFKELLVNFSSTFDYDIKQIDLNPKLVLVVPQCNEQLLRTLSYFEDIDSEVIELSRISNGNSVEIKKQTYLPKSIFHKDDLVTIQNKVTQSWDFNKYVTYGINKDKVNLAKTFSNQVKHIFESKGYEFDSFFTDTKVTITKDGKVWGHLFIKQKQLDYRLTVSFKISKDVTINSIDFTYNPSIESFNEQKSSIKLVLSNSLTSSLLAKYI